ncbi:MAG TPA: patatin-like phospholipase family protein [Methylibium sp.]
MNAALYAARRVALVIVLGLLGACSTTRPWVNQPLAPSARLESTPALNPMLPVGAPPGSPQVIAAVALSGGGARAAAFGLGVLEELKATRFALGGRSTTLLDEVGLVSGVSGGSVLATYYAAFGDEVFTRFEPEFLKADFQSSLIGYILSPASLYRLTSPWYGRSNVLAERLAPVFRGLTFGDLKARPRGPRLLITAADLTTGAPFEFTPEQFALICSDLDSMPLSFAAAASSSVPLLLSPITLRNYAGSCPQSAQVVEAAMADHNLSARLLRTIAKSYQNSSARPYLHLVDGGLVDNLGVRSLLDHTIARGSLRQSFEHLPPGSVHRVVLVSVNSERDLGDRLDDSGRVPSTVQVLDALVFGAGSRTTTETSAMVVDAARRLAEELVADRGSAGSPFAADAQLHVISVSLRDVPDEALRQQLLQVPTAFTILPLQVRQLREAGRSALRASAEFQKLVQGLQGQDAPMSIAGNANAANSTD